MVVYHYWLTLTEVLGTAASILLVLVLLFPTFYRRGNGSTLIQESPFLKLCSGLEVSLFNWEVVPADCPWESCISICNLHINVTPCDVWDMMPSATEGTWGEMKSVSIYSWLSHFLNIYNKNLEKEGMHQAKSLGIIFPVSSFMMCYVNSLVISQNEGILITFSLNSFCQTEHAGISMTKEVIMSIFRVSRPKSESFKRCALG